jgi:UDP-N-acetylmuramoyl-tripeptide--D-alanyl-D-alanine ligase
MQLHEEAGLLLINDSYNANPDSMAAALRTLSLLAQERGGLSWAFLGKMNELGESTAEEHYAIGRLVSDIGIDHLVMVGTTLFTGPVTGERKLSEDVGDDTTVHVRESIDDAVPLADHFASGDVVLVKASRSENFDELAQKLLDRWREKPA